MHSEGGSPATPSRPPPSPRTLALGSPGTAPGRVIFFLREPGMKQQLPSPALRPTHLRTGQKVVLGTEQGSSVPPSSLLFPS